MNLTYSSDQNRIFEDFVHNFSASGLYVKTNLVAEPSGCCSRSRLTLVNVKRIGAQGFTVMVCHIGVKIRAKP
jgi:hypothetical protein